MSAPKVGDVVRVERDESRYPSRGTWPQFRGRVGTVVEVNRDSKRPHLTEYGVVFEQVAEREDRPGNYVYSSFSVTWFKIYELTICTASEMHRGRRNRGRRTDPSEAAT